jgi:hypothetical protein
MKNIKVRNLVINDKLGFIISERLILFLIMGLMNILN